MADTSTPNTSSTAGQQAQSALSTAQDYAASASATVKNNAASAADAIRNSDIANGPVATSVKNQTAATSNEISNLAAAKKTPEYTAANDTTLTHYHSWFFELFSWKHPRATALTFAASIIFILASRYVPLSRLVLKALWTSLGVVTLAEIATKTVMGTSVAGSVRPRRYYKIPKETLEATLDDVEQLINFFVIEVQRIIFAENIPVTAAAFLATFVSYYLVKLMPTWGFVLFSDCVLFLTPLVYVQNKELIDSQLEHASSVIGEQTAQIKDITAQHTSKGLESVKAYTGEYASAASEYIGKSRQKIQMPATNGGTNKAASIKKEDFPSAPSTNLPTSGISTETKPREPVLSS